METEDDADMTAPGWEAAFSVRTRVVLSLGRQLLNQSDSVGRYCLRDAASASERPHKHFCVSSCMPCQEACMLLLCAQRTVKDSIAAITAMQQCCNYPVLARLLQALHESLLEVVQVFDDCAKHGMIRSMINAGGGIRRMVGSLAQRLSLPNTLTHRKSVCQWESPGRATFSAPSATAHSR